LEDLISGKTTIEGFCGERKEYVIKDITETVITGGTPSTNRREYYGGNIPWLSSTEIHQKRITRPTTYISELGLQNSSAKIAPEKSVLIALAGQGKTRGTVAYLTRPMALNQSLAALVTNDKCNPEFLYYLIESMYLLLRELSSGDGGRGGLNKKLIEGISVVIPEDIVEQEAIAKTLSLMDEEIEALEVERDKIIQIREGAMDDLLTGRVRLKT
jgi:type I restriction enzyme S subunit